MSAAWYYAKNKERFGPVSLAELRSLVAQGKLRPADLVWTDQLPAWTPAGKVRELFPLRAVAVPEPATLGLVGVLVGFIGIGAVCRRRGV
jgi:hypothetical protein